MEQAKFNLVHKYFLVGVTEELKDFVAMMEYSLPRIFKGALHLYNTGNQRRLLYMHLKKYIIFLLSLREDCVFIGVGLFVGLSVSLLARKVMDGF